MAASMSKAETKKLIKKQRKRLKEIEHLERQNRTLSSEEKVKVKGKRKLRKNLQSLLAEYIAKYKAKDEDEDVTEETNENVDDHGNEPCGRDEDIGHHSSEQNKEYGLSHKEETPNIGTTNIQENTQKQSPKDKGQEKTKVEKKCDLQAKAPPISTPSGDGTARQHKEVRKQPLQDKVEVSEDNKIKKRADVTIKEPPKIPTQADGACKETKTKKLPKPGLSAKQFKVKHLEGHSDLITAVTLHEETLVSASRDTTVKAWNILTGAQKKNFGGHTDSVTCLIVLDVKDAQKAVSDVMESEETVVVSGSFDCTVKVWSMNTGRLLKSVYTYNPVSHIAYVSEASLLALGSDTGKIELWDLNSKEQRYSIHAYDASVTGIKVAGKLLYSSASDGTVKIYNITDDRRLSCVFESERVSSTSGGHLIPRHIRSLELCPKGALIGDDAKNIKVLNWRKNEASKISNHHSEFSSTDAIRCHGDYIVASSYDLDSGLGYINVRSSHSLDYQASLDDQDTERILCLDVRTLPGGNLVIATGGVDLKLWEVFKQSIGQTDDVFRAEFRGALAKAAVDSEDEDEDDDDDDDEDDDNMNEREPTGPRNKKLEFQQETETGSWLSWCAVI